MIRGINWNSPLVVISNLMSCTNSNRKWKLCIDMLTNVFRFQYQVFFWKRDGCFQYGSRFCGELHNCAGSASFCVLQKQTWNLWMRGFKFKRRGLHMGPKNPSHWKRGHKILSWTIYWRLKDYSKSVILKIGSKGPFSHFFLWQNYFPRVKSGYWGHIFH